MNLMCQMKTTSRYAQLFIKNMENSGYKAVREEYVGGWNVHFVKDGEVTIDYEVSKVGPVHFVGVRPT